MASLWLANGTSMSSERKPSTFLGAASTSQPRKAEKNPPSGGSCICARTATIFSRVAVRSRFARKASSTSTRKLGIASSVSPQVISTDRTPSASETMSCMGPIRRL
ncbi:MAG: hypothetical protein SOH58_07985 [Olsenella sp.]|jgi:hypothetical protein